MAPRNENPMSLENLPGYLKSAKESGNAGAPVVQMGQIVVPQTSYMQWLQRVVYTVLVFMAIGIGGMTTYHIMSTKQLTVVVNVDSGVDQSAIAKMVADSGGEVLAVKQTEESTYEIKVATHKSRRSFLEWLLKNRDVKQAKLEE